MSARPSHDADTLDGVSLVDVHCHLDHWMDAPEALLQRAEAAGVDAIVMAGVEPSNWADQQRLCERFDSVFAVFGIHPQKLCELGPDASRVIAGALEQLRAQLSTPPRHQNGQSALVALGEIGLDRSHARHKATFPQQIDLFREQLALARQADLPVVLHVLDAHGAALRILELDGLPRAGGLLHAYSGSAELVLEYARLGLQFSMGAALTRPAARKTHRAGMAIPSTLLHLESDAPYQPVFGSVFPNEPSSLPIVLQALARLRAVDPRQLALSTQRNSRSLFGLDAR